MGCGAAGTRYRNMGQRGEVMQRKTLAVKIWGEPAIGDARLDGDSARYRIQRNPLVDRLQRQKMMRAVGDGVEAVACAEHLHLALLLHKTQHPFQGNGG